MAGNEPVRIGVIGCGSVGRWSYMPRVHDLNLRGKRAEMVIACDVDPALVRESQDLYGIPEGTTDYQEVIHHPEVDLVLVLTSMPLHGVITKAALLAGKHVLVEKPMAMTLEEAGEILEIAKTSPGILVCAPHVVLSPTYRELWKTIHRGDIGEIHLARGMYGWSGPWWGPFFYQKGGGAMFDLGVYNVTTLTGLLGPAKRVMAMSGIAIPEREVNGQRMTVETHDNAHLLLDFGDACYASITTGFTIQAYHKDVPGIEIYGGKGTIQMQGEDWLPRGYYLYQTKNGFWEDHPAGGWHWTDGLRHAVECIQTGTKPIVQPEHAYHVLEIMLKSMESGDTGRAIEIESTFTPPTFDLGPAAGAAAHLVHDPTSAE
jgi:predicted dehydrogenase